MMVGGFLFLLLLTGGSAQNYSESTESYEDQQYLNESSEEPYSPYVETCNKSYQDIVEHLNLSKDNTLYTMARPVKNYKDPTVVTLQIMIHTILDVREIEQTFLPYIWLYMTWKNEHISWDRNKFCGIKYLSVPTEVLWRPDLKIEETTERQKTPSYVFVSNDGKVEFINDMALVSTCKIHVYKFPFDVQRCNISFRSALHPDHEIKFEERLGSQLSTKWTQETIRNQEWLFMDLNVTQTTPYRFISKYSVIVYTITMKRRYALYVANFMAPVLFFLCLDLASFMISDRGGEKLSFKVTVLLAVTVMQLILNEILPASSDRLPLISVYCIGMVGLMMLSLLETILVMYLLEKDNEADEGQTLKVKKWTDCASICAVSAEETPAELLPMAKEGSGSQVMEEVQALEKVTNDLKEIVRTLSVVANIRNEGKKPGYWSRVTKIINRVFFISYVIAASLFLLSLCLKWNDDED